MNDLKKNKDQQFKEIWLPLILSIVICVGLMILVLTVTSDGAVSSSLLADVALILLIAPTLLVILAIIVILVLMNGGVNRFARWIPGILEKGQKMSSFIETKARTAAIVIAYPLVKSRELVSTAKALFSTIFKRWS
jgi:predicted PurR-regulated permease PerM